MRLLNRWIFNGAIKLHSASSSLLGQTILRFRIRANVISGLTVIDSRMFMRNRDTYVGLTLFLHFVICDGKFHAKYFKKTCSNSSRNWSGDNYMYLFIFLTYSTEAK